MASGETAAVGEQVFKPCGRAFFVHYVWIVLWLVGPLINPKLGVPVWLGIVLALPVAGAVAYMKWGQEYRITSRGVAKVWFWPALKEQEITWGSLGEVTMRRGLTQSLLVVGNLLIQDKAGDSQMFWYGLSNPKEVKARIEARRP